MECSLGSRHWVWHFAYIISFNPPKLLFTFSQKKKKKPWNDNSEIQAQCYATSEEPGINDSHYSVYRSLTEVESCILDPAPSQFKVTDLLSGH